MAKYESNLTAKEKEEIHSKSAKATRGKLSKLKEFLTRKRTPSKIKTKKEQADVEKELPRGKPAPSQMEDYKPSAKPETFSQAFKKARMEGVDEFLFGGKKYAAVTKEELGSKSLREYLNEKRQRDQEADNE